MKNNSIVKYEDFQHRIRKHLADVFDLPEEVMFMQFSTGYSLSRRLEIELLKQVK